MEIGFAVKMPSWSVRPIRRAASGTLLMARVIEMRSKPVAEKGLMAMLRGAPLYDAKRQQLRQRPHTWLAGSSFQDFHDTAALASQLDLVISIDTSVAHLAGAIGLFDGSLTAIPGTDRGFPDWSSVPRHVSRLCAEMHPVEPGWKQEVKRKQTGQGIIKDDPQMAAAYADALEILEGGGTMTDVRAMLLLRFPDSGAAVREPYREDEYQEI